MNGPRRGDVFAAVSMTRARNGCAREKRSIPSQGKQDTIEKILRKPEEDWTNEGIMRKERIVVRAVDYSHHVSWELSSCPLNDQHRSERLSFQCDSLCIAEFLAPSSPTTVFREPKPKLAVHLFDSLMQLWFAFVFGQG